MTAAGGVVGGAFRSACLLHGPPLPSYNIVFRALSKTLETSDSICQANCCGFLFQISSPTFAASQ